MLLKAALLSGLLTVCLSAVSLAGEVHLSNPKCPKPDTSFATFLKRFEEDAAFQHSRLAMPLVLRSGDDVTSEATIRLLMTPDDIRKFYGSPLIYSAKEREKLSLHEDISLFAPASARAAADVYQGQGDADSIRIALRFRTWSGCWVLEELDNYSQ
ncbi:MAG TPA: hypothetical protein VHL34_05460 [Rhizomicrobium sp.]|nr:hypothetical protein [Rhizomicrobium sp.]